MIQPQTFECPSWETEFSQRINTLSEISLRTEVAAPPDQIGGTGRRGFPPGRGLIRIECRLETEAKGNRWPAILKSKVRDGEVIRRGSVPGNDFAGNRYWPGSWESSSPFRSATRRLNWGSRSKAPSWRRILGWGVLRGLMGPDQHPRKQHQSDGCFGR